MDKCIFCKIARHKISAHVLLENKHATAFLDSDPISDGHTLIIPQKHIRDIHSLDKTSGAQIMQMAKKMADVLKRTFKYDGIMIMQVNGHFQDIPHFHLHVFGRNKENDIKIKYPSGVDVTPEHLKINAEKMREQLIHAK